MTEEPTTESTFPLPPQKYISLYTDENIAKGVAPKPPPPLQDSYTMFGVQFRADDQIISPLENQNIKRLHPHTYDHKRELKKLNYSILVNFLDLLDILIKSCDSPKRVEKIDDLTLLFIHMHHLINEFRPHQARETLRVMLEMQKRQRLETIDQFQKHLNLVQELLDSSLNALPSELVVDATLLEPVAPKREPETTEDEEVEDLDVEDYRTQDEMMCDIVDALL